MTDYARVAELIDAAGVQLAANMRTGYTQGHEKTLAAALLAEAGELAPEVLDALMVEHLVGLVMVDCLLNECDEASYETVRAMAATVCAEVRRQGRELIAVRELVLDAICAGARVEQTVADLRRGVS